MPRRTHLRRSPPATGRLCGASSEILYSNNARRPTRATAVVVKAQQNFAQKAVAAVLASTLLAGVSNGIVAACHGMSDRGYFK